LIVGFHHVVLAVRDLAAAAGAYETLLDRRALCSDAEDGVATALITTDNIAVELMAPTGDGAAAQRLRAALADGEGLKSLVFATADLNAAHRRFERVGLAPEAITARGSFRLNTERTHGVRHFVMGAHRPAATPAAVSGLDHVVVRTPDAERAAALYGARLGLDMRLDREVRGARLMFFRCGDAVVEIIHDTAIEDRRDRLWGLSWRVLNAETEHARLAAAGVDVSDVRVGMKPGTRVFTVRSGACGVPTLMIEAAKREA
jgi:catechol 2,3-dioxygenase-like lactoylglutathione lyase family enzyme